MKERKTVPVIESTLCLSTHLASQSGKWVLMLHLSFKKLHEYQGLQHKRGHCSDVWESFSLKTITQGCTTPLHFVMQFKNCWSRKKLGFTSLFVQAPFLGPGKSQERTNRAFEDPSLGGCD